MVAQPCFIRTFKRPKWDTELPSFIGGVTFKSMYAAGGDLLGTEG